MEISWSGSEISGGEKAVEKQIKSDTILLISIEKKTKIQFYYYSK